MSEYPSIDDYILNELDIQPEDFDTYDDYLNAIRNEFKNNLSSAVIDSVNYIWSDRVETFDDYVQEITEPLFEKIYSDIDKIMEEPLTKREQTVQVLETAEIPFTIKEFVEATGMNPNTARRELGQGVKKGLFKRVSRGVYEQL